MRTFEEIYELLSGMVEIPEELLALSEGVSEIRATSKYKTPYTENIFEKYDSEEKITSWALAEIFRYKLDGEAVILKSFAGRFLKEKGFHLENIRDPKIIAEKEGRIDVLIKEDGYCIIIENKLKGADYQRNQLARYIYKQVAYPKDKVFIVLLPKVCYCTEHYASTIRDSVWKLPVDYLEPNFNRKCRVDEYQCWCDVVRDFSKEERDYCKNCKLFTNYIDRTVTIHSDLAEWLMEDCLNVIPQEEFILRSFVIQLADFLKLQYKTRESEKLVEEMKEYLRKKLGLIPENGDERNLDIVNDQLKDLSQLTDALNEMKKDFLCAIGANTIKEWYTTLCSNPDFGKLVQTDGKSFGIQIRGIWCGCWYKDNVEFKPYWGFWKSNFTKEDEKMVSDDENVVLSIMKQSGMEDIGKKENDFIRWANTDNGDEECTKFYYAAIKLGYLKV